MTITLTFLETVALAAAILVLGTLLTHHIPILRHYAIPIPVTGGLCFAVVANAMHGGMNLDLAFDMTLKEPCMLAFFATVGLSADLRMVANGGARLALFLAVATLFLIVQNGIGTLLALSLGLHPLFGLLSGSITLSGGHGTGAAYADLFTTTSDLHNPMEVAMACATFGLVVGGLIGGPVAHRLITKFHLTAPSQPVSLHPISLHSFRHYGADSLRKGFETLLVILGCLVVGKVASQLFNQRFHFTLPTFIWTLMCGVAFRNICEFTGLYHLSQRLITTMGTISLSFFLAFAFMTLRLWELRALVGSLLIILVVQTLVMALYASVITFRVMGKTYEAAVMASGHCGFGMGATPTAIANMEALVSRHGPAPEAFLIIPLVGAFFIDLANALVIQTYLAFLPS
ncbi:MAG: sodium/glutamate symporter [Nitrospirae bacterium]|nr:MAG: sodium/glutamate symporter [Nitrospirota bacterium]